jgi:hypothetical protein
MQKQNTWWIGGLLAALGAGTAVVLGHSYTGWLLVRPDGPTVGDYALFVGASTLVAFVGALPGLLVGALLSRGSHGE